MSEQRSRETKDSSSNEHIQTWQKSFKVLWDEVLGSKSKDHFCIKTTQYLIKKERKKENLTHWEAWWRQYHALKDISSRITRLLLKGNDSCTKCEPVLNKSLEISTEKITKRDFIGQLYLGQVSLIEPTQRWTRGGTCRLQEVLIFHIFEKTIKVFFFFFLYSFIC